MGKNDGATVIIAEFDPTASQVGAAAAVIQTVLVAAALLFAWRQLVHSRETREATERPFVVVEFLSDDQNHWINLEIANHGQTAARDVRFEIEPELVSTLDDTGFGVKEMSLIKDGIPLLGPGRRISLLFDTTLQRIGGDQGLPDRFEVVVSYDGEPDRRGRRRRYSDPMPLDIGSFRGRMSTTRHNLHDVHAELEKIRKELHKWTASSGGIVTRTRAELAQEHAKWREEMEARQRAPEALEPESGNSGDNEPEVG